MAAWWWEPWNSWALSLTILPHVIRRVPGMGVYGMLIVVAKTQIYFTLATKISASTLGGWNEKYMRPGQGWYVGLFFVPVQSSRRAKPVWYRTKIILIKFLFYSHRAKPSMIWALQIFCSKLKRCQDVRQQVKFYAGVTSDFNRHPTYLSAKFSGWIHDHVGGEQKPSTPVDGPFVLIQPGLQ